MEGRRPLCSLPKAHLHLHVWQAAVRRSTVQEWLSECDEERLREMRAVAERRLQEALAELEAATEAERPLLQRNAAKYERRVAALTPPLSVERVLGPVVEAEAAPPPPLLGGSGPESEIWDRQFVVSALMDSMPASQGGLAAAERRACLELAEDAAAEGICWMELAGEAFKFAKGEGARIEEGCAAGWRASLTARREAMAAYPGVGIGFVVPCPKGEGQAEEARAVLDFFASEGEREALAGVGKWGREFPGLEAALGPALAAFRAAGVPLVTLHAGEGYGATGEKLPPEAYDGAGLVEEAVAAGAARVGHGIEAARRGETMALLRERCVCLEVCLYSNWLLGMAPWAPAGAPHPLTALLEGGVRCCLAADDPTLMGAENGHGLVREYEAARQVLGLSDAQLADLARASIRSCSMPGARQQEVLAGIDAWLAAEP